MSDLVKYHVAWRCPGCNRPIAETLRTVNRTDGITERHRRCNWCALLWITHETRVMVRSVAEPLRLQRRQVAPPPLVCTYRKCLNTPQEGRRQCTTHIEYHRAKRARRVANGGKR